MLLFGTTAASMVPMQMNLVAKMSQIAVVDADGNVVASMSTDRKTATYLDVRHKSSSDTVLPNAFGLTPIDSCPGATKSCMAICYAEGIVWPMARAKWATNTEFCMTANLADMTKAFGLLVDGFRKLTFKKNTVEITDEDGNKKKVQRDSTDKNYVPLNFRLMSSGDFPNRDCAKAWATVAKNNPDIRFWGYTRTFEVMDEFVGIKNLAIFASVDPDNKGSVDELPEGTRFAFMGSKEWAVENFPERDVRNYECPELKENIPMYTEIGTRKRPYPEKGTTVKGAKGACATCMLCFPTKNSGDERGNDISFVPGTFDGAGNRHEIDLEDTTSAVMVTLVRRIRQVA